MRLMMAFDLTEDEIGHTLWWNPEDAIDPAGDGRIEIVVAGVEKVPPSGEFPGGGVIVSEDLRIIPGATMIGISEEEIPV